MTKDELVLSTLPKTWIIDLDGTLFKHNGYKIDGYDTPIKDNIEFLSHIPQSDKIILLTARCEKYCESTKNTLDSLGIRYDEIIFNAPFGERILINDSKPSGLKTAYAINIERDRKIDISIKYDASL